MLNLCFFFFIDCSMQQRDSKTIKTMHESFAARHLMESVRTVSISSKKQRHASYIWKKKLTAFSFLTANLSRFVFSEPCTSKFPSCFTDIKANILFLSKYILFWLFVSVSFLGIFTQNQANSRGPTVSFRWTCQGRFCLLLLFYSSKTSISDAT